MDNLDRRAGKMSVLLSLSLTSVLLIFSHIALASGYETTYEFGADCPIFTKDVDEGNEIYIEYKGKDVESYCDDLKFRGRGNDILDEYSVCVTPLYFNDDDCAVEIDIKTSFNGVTKHKITCTDNSANYCGPQDETLYIVFKKRFGKSTRNANFKLKITTKKEYDYDESHAYLIGAIVGGIIGGLVLITVCIAIFCWCVCRRKPSQGTVFNPAQGYPGTGNPYVVYDAQTQQNTMTTPSSISSPGVYPMASYPEPGGPTNPQTHGNNLSDPPPNYDAATETSTSHVYDTIQDSSRPPTNDEVVCK